MLAAVRGFVEQGATFRLAHPPISIAAAATISAMPSHSRRLGRFAKQPQRDGLGEQHLDQRQRAHPRGVGEREGDEPELRRQRAHETGDQRARAKRQDRLEPGAVEQGEPDQQQAVWMASPGTSRSSPPSQSTASPSASPRRGSRPRRRRRRVAETSPIAIGRQPARAASAPLPDIRQTPRVASTIAPTSVTSASRRETAARRARPAPLRSW